MSLKNSKLTPKKIFALCKNKRVLLLTHENADLDSFCSAAMMQLFLKKNKFISEIAVPKHINEQTQHFAFSEKISFLVNPMLEDYEVVILFDLNNFDQLGKLREKFKELSKSKAFEVFVFDHHVIEKDCITKTSNCLVDENAFSTTQLIHDFLATQNKVLLSPQNQRFCLDTLDSKLSFFCCIGLLEDTGNFIVGDASAFSTFAECLRISKKTYSEVLAYTKHTIPEDERIAFLKAAQRANIQKINNIIVVSSELSFYQSAAATKLLDFGAHIALVAGREKNELTTLSARAESIFKEKNKFNLVKDLLIPLQKELGGEIGGHSGAAQWKGMAESKRVLGVALNILKSRF